MEKEDKFWDMEENWLTYFTVFHSQGGAVKTVVKICSLEYLHWAKHFWELIDNVPILGGRFDYLSRV